MRPVLIFLLGISYVASRSNTKSLTESMGQEVIEIGTPIKELPPDLEEEPSAEAEEPDKGTSTTLQPATPRERKTDATVESRRKLKDIYKIDSVKQVDDETRIEKELAEMYKDTDYKADSGEVVKEEQATNSTKGTEKPIARMRNNFKFQPDRYNSKEVERFRTSVDDISCAKNKLVGVTTVPSSGYIPTLCRIIFWSSFILI